MANTTHMLNYLAPVSLCYNYSFLYDLLFIHPEASIGIVKERFLEYLEYLSISISKKQLKLKFWETSQKDNHGVLHSSTFADLLGELKTTLLERFMLNLDVPRKACRRNFNPVQNYAHAITCFIWRSLNKLCSTFRSMLYLLLNEK